MSGLSDRMAEYEVQYDFSILRRAPLVVRVDGKNFSRYTEKLEKPFDNFFSQAMALTTHSTAEKIDGCVLAYTQSDEASFILRNDQSNETMPWLNNRVQKIISIVASMFSVQFNSILTGRHAFFDARVFALPNLVEVENYLISRQQDATRNSIQLAARYEVAKKIGRKTALKKLNGLNIKQQQELLFQETGLNWNDYPIKFKRGIVIYKERVEKIVEDNKVFRNVWKIDVETPIFKDNKTFLTNLFQRTDAIQL